MGKFSQFLPCDEWMPLSCYCCGHIVWEGCTGHDSVTCRVTGGDMSRRPVVTLLLCHIRTQLSRITAVCHNMLYCIGKMFRPHSQTLWSPKSINLRRGELVLKTGQASLFLAAQTGGILWPIDAAGRKLTLNQLTNQSSRNRVYLQASADPSGKILALKLAQNLEERAAAGGRRVGGRPGWDGAHYYYSSQPRYLFV